MRLFSIILLYLLVSCSLLNDNPRNHLVEEVQQIDSLTQHYFSTGAFNGNIVVHFGDQEIFKKSLGYTEGSRLQTLSDSSVFSIGSISKEFQAVSIMKLVDDGHLKIDDNLSVFFPDFPIWADSISIYHLLNNVSGLPQLNFKTVKGKNDLLEDLANTDKLLAIPGTEYLYNHNIPILLNSVIEKTSGLSFQEFVQEAFLNEQNMNETIFDPERDYPNLVQSYNSSFTNDSPYNPFKGWVYTTSSDLMKWLQAIHSERILSDKSYAKLIQNEFFPEHLSSLGSFKITEKGQTIHHWGGFFNYVSLAYVNIDKDLFIVLLSNNGCRDLLGIAEKIDSLLKVKILQNSLLGIPD